MAPTPPASVHVLRMLVPSAASRRVVLGHPGILCIGVPAQEGLPALVLVYDESAGNEGASATNAMETVFETLSQSWCAWLDLTSTNLVQRDSEGLLDHVVLQVDSRGAVTVGWSPIRWAGKEPRSKAAFLGLFGAQAVQAERKLLDHGLTL